MGNTSSHPNGSASGSGLASPSTPQVNTSSTLPSSSNTTTGPSQPIRTGTPLVGTTGSSSTTGTTTNTVPAFHSGLTPPARDPSPVPPSTPPLLPYGGHLSPQNPHALSLPQTHDYSKSTVTRLILEARLAPFYRGLEDFEEDWTEEDLTKLLNEIREKDFTDDVKNSVVEKMKEERENPTGMGSVTKKIGIHRHRDARREEEHAERDKREVRAYLGGTECPICFLYYPPNINTSRCCQQPICTECFVQIKRGEATLTHLESEPASCPFCVETEFGVIYERPATISVTSLQSESALAVSPEQGTSGFSQALSARSEEAELSVGPGMAPKAQEKMRRKSVSSKAAEVVTIDQIRPDWEDKLNAVKAAAARKASRRIVMRQVGDRLIPIGFTSARAPGTADFSMSTGGSSDENGSRRSRRRTGTDSRGRDLEELMIMEAMRLSLLDHDEHQRRLIEDPSRPSGSGSGTHTPTTSPNNYNGESSRSSLKPPKESSAAKFLSKLGGRSRSNSAASNKNVSFANFPISAPRSRSGSNTNSPMLTPTATRDNRSSSLSNLGSTVVTSPTSFTLPSPTSANTATTTTTSPTTITSTLNPASAAPTVVAPVTTMTNHTALQDSPISPMTVPPTTNTISSNVDKGQNSTGDGSDVTTTSSPPGPIPKLSVDMAPMEPEHQNGIAVASDENKVGSTMAHVEEQSDDQGPGHLERPAGYARLNSDVA